MIELNCVTDAYDLASVQEILDREMIKTHGTWSISEAGWVKAEISPMDLFGKSHETLEKIKDLVGIEVVFHPDINERREEDSPR